MRQETPARRLRPCILPMVTVAVLVVRLTFAGLIHLTEDEAYYRLWSMAPSLGYYDHPPMIAWWITIGRTLAGDTPLGVRLLPVIANALTALLVYDITRLLGGTERTATRAGVWLNATFLLGVGAMLATPDAPASFFWTLAVWAALNARRHAPERWWAIAGVAAGLAALSKYSALFLAPGIFIWLLSSAEGRTTLRRPGPWIAAVIAVGLFSLNALWNAQHDWVTFARQFGRVEPARFAPKYLPELLLGQLVLLNPLIAAFALRGLSRNRWRGVRFDLAPPLLISLPFAAYLVLHSLHDRVQAHWPVPLYPAAVILAAVFAQSIRPGSLLRPLRRAAPVVGYVVSGLILLHLAWPGADIQASFEPALALRRWPDFAQQLESARLREGAHWVGTLSYGTAAQLAAERDLKAPVFEIAERNRYAFQPASAAPDMTDPGLVVDLERRASGADLKVCFRDVRLLGYVDRGSTKGPDALYRLYRVEGPKRLLKGGCWLGEDLSR